MAISWPSYLPSLLRNGLTIKPITSAKVRPTQSGRNEITRWGAGGGDTVSGTIRLRGAHPVYGDQVQLWRNWWDREANFGINWISAHWLELLGYSNCQCKILGYSLVASKGRIYSDISVTMLVAPIVEQWAVPNTSWLDGPRHTDIYVTDISPDDTFAGDDGDAPDSARWSIESLYTATVSIQSNSLKFQATNTLSTALLILQSKFRLVGAFDVQVDVSADFSVAAEAAAAMVQLTSADGTGLDLISLDLLYGGWGTVVRSDLIVDGVVHPYVDINTGTILSSCKFRFIRTASGLISAYYWTGTRWHAVRADSFFSQEDIRFRFTPLNTTPCIFTVNFDNFAVNHGVVVFDV